MTREHFEREVYDLCVKARKEYITFNVRHLRGDMYMFSSFHRSGVNMYDGSDIEGATHPTIKGRGSDYLHLLLDVAEDHGITIVLWTKAAKLVPYYMDRGFTRFHLWRPEDGYKEALWLEWTPCEAGV